MRKAIVPLSAAVAVVVIAFAGSLLASHGTQPAKSSTVPTPDTNTVTRLIDGSTQAQANGIKASNAHIDVVSGDCASGTVIVSVGDPTTASEIGFRLHYSHDASQWTLETADPNIAGCQP